MPFTKVTETYISARNVDPESDRLKVVLENDQAIYFKLVGQSAESGLTLVLSVDWILTGQFLYEVVVGELKKQESVAPTNVSYLAEKVLLHTELLYSRMEHSLELGRRLQVVIPFGRDGIDYAFPSNVKEIEPITVDELLARTPFVKQPFDHDVASRASGLSTAGPSSIPRNSPWWSVFN